MLRRTSPLAFLTIVLSCTPDATTVEPCTSNADCDDSDICTIDRCQNGTCIHETDAVVECAAGQGLCDDGLDCPPPSCEDENGLCQKTCDTDEDCDDGLFCNGYDFCDGGTCRASPEPCGWSTLGLALCDEAIDRCYQCDADSDCAKGQTCGSGLCTGFCGEVECRSEDLCSATHCMGDEGCASSFVFCDSGKRCDPATGACVSIGETCLSQCGIGDRACCVLDSPGCQPKELDEFNDFTTTLAEWERSIPCDPDTFLDTWLIVGQCDNGMLVVRGSDDPGWAIHTSFFEASTGKFLATMTDSFIGEGIPDSCNGQVYWPFKPECESITVIQVLCGTIYHVGDIVSLDPCRSQCEIRGCPEAPLESFPDFETTREQWIADSLCADGYPYLLVGMCENGTPFLFYSMGFTIEFRFFDPTDGSFLAMLKQSDVGDSRCCGVNYWPIQIECPRGIITEFPCNPDYAAGDSITLPTVTACRLYP